MATERIDDPVAFRRFLDAKLAGEETGLTLDECLDLWEHENRPDEERALAVQAVREALDDMKAGDSGLSAKNVVAELRRKHGLP